MFPSGQIPTMTPMMDFKAFIESEMRQRRMSQREFAEYVGISHQTINRIVAGDAPEPSLSVLVRLARKTHTDLCSLIALLYPDESRGNARARIIAERIAQLTPAQQQIIDNVLIGITSSQDNN